MSTQHAKELTATIVGGAALRHLAREAAKFIPGPGWVIAGAVASVGTWAIGQVAIQYFELGKNMGPRGLQSLYRQKVKQRRGTKAAGEIGAQASGR